MKNKSISLISVLFTLLLVMYSSCKDELTAEKDSTVLKQSLKDVSPERSDSTNKKTLGNFKNLLAKEMSYDELVTLFGKPDADVGSGFHIYEYRLDDGTYVWIGFTDQLIYGVHLDAARQVISEFLK